MNEHTSGILIAIEGIDGCGKSTLAPQLYSYFSEKAYNFPCLLTREPSTTALGKAVRALLSEQPAPLSPLSEFLLFAADRAEHFKNIVLPALQKNMIVISDRLSDSSLAYQGYGRGVDLTFIETVNKECMQQREPDLVIYLKIDLETALYRIHHRKLPLTSFEKEENSFWKKVINGFDTLFAKKKNCLIIDATKPIDQVFEETIKKLQPYLKL